MFYDFYIFEKKKNKILNLKFTYKKVIKNIKTIPPVSPPSARIAFFLFDTEVSLLNKTSRTISRMDSTKAKIILQLRKKKKKQTED